MARYELYTAYQRNLAATPLENQIGGTHATDRVSRLGGVCRHPFPGCNRSAPRPHVRTARPGAGGDRTPVLFASDRRYTDLRGGDASRASGKESQNLSQAI